MIGNVQIEPTERKMCTVMFVDIVKSTMMIGSLDPEDAIDQVGPAIELIMSTCESNGATTLFTGDGALAVFGSPHADEDHAIKAIASARKIIQRLSEMDGKQPDVRIGLHCGELLVGHLQHTLGEEQAFLGPVMNIAGTIESRARHNVVTVSGAVIEHAGGIFEHERVGELVLDNLAEPIGLYEIQARKDQASRWHSRVRRGRSPFVGRAGELEQLLSAWNSAIGGQGNAALLIGTAGIGKSRLLHEFADKILLGRYQAIEFNCISLDQDAAYLPITRAITSHLQHSASGLDVSLEAQLSELLGDAPDLDDATRHALFSLFTGVQTSVEPSAADPMRRRRLLVDALARIILALDSEDPLLLIIEDLHWADKGTLDVVHALLDQVSSTRTLILLTSRNADFVSTDPKPLLDVIHVSPLETAACRDLIRLLLDDASVNKMVAAYIEDLSDRTPLFVEEFVYNIRERLPEENYLHKLPEILDDIDIPARVQPLIAARIDALEPEDRRALQIVAVGGLQWNHQVLLRTLSGQFQNAQERIQSLIEQGLLEFATGDRSQTIRFSHALMQKVGYRSIPRLRRTKHHRAIYETLYGGGYTDNLDLMQSVARHADGGELWLEAAKSYNHCGHLSVKLFSFDAAVSFFEHALRCIGKIRHETDELHVARLGLRSRQGLRVSLVASGDFERILTISREAEELCQKIGDTAARIASQIDQGIMMTVLSDVREATRVSRFALVNAEACGDTMLQAKAAFALAQAAWFNGDYVGAASAIDRHVDLFAETFRTEDIGTTGSISVLGLATRANAHSMAGRFEAAEDDISTSLAVAEETGKAYDLCFALVAKGIKCCVQSRLDSGIAALRRALRTAEYAGLDVLCCFAAAPLARMLAQKHQFTEARTILNKGLSLAQLMKMDAFEAWLLTAEVQVLLEEGRRLEAEELSVDLLDLCRRNGYFGFREELKAIMKSPSYIRH
ncbi:adenylate/guanylate cyclase domain-containing protein [Ruegeria sp. R14_0]|uniref:ATP-binding protein n=1 Tax=Ruegeria sp. R14_0 TaxID=2821100 RepID=UPI001ADBD4BB|nr:adenylate/guanylate cyclase domain-containing protein [Ruegeria sp. R14_0]MBO9446758.1 AAA family ATPase [Ruegeria sp. R14_0]